MKLANLQNCSTSTPTHVRVHYNVENEENIKENDDKQGLEEDKRTMQGRAEMEESMTEHRKWSGEKGEM